jgi:asparagine synthase (glutamine-hydrolysing)
MGFSVPIDRWLRGPLREWAADHLAIAKGDAYVDHAIVNREWSAFQRGGSSHALGLWAVALFQAWRIRWGT